MPGLPKLFLVVVVIFAVWYAMRLVNRRPQANPPTRRQAARPMIEAEDLVACRVCGTYMPAGARSCGKSGCPHPR